MVALPSPSTFTSGINTFRQCVGRICEWVNGPSCVSLSSCILGGRRGRDDGEITWSPERDEIMRRTEEKLLLQTQIYV